jgi:hypothetical protein
MAGKRTTTRKIGDGHASAMFRQGLRELRGALYPDSNVAQPSELGLYGTLTPGEIGEARRGDERATDGDAGDSILAGRLRQVRARDEAVRNEPEMDRD